MKIALIQFNSIWESKKENLVRAEHFVKRASEEKCDLVVFPEMFATGFSMNIAAAAEEGFAETALMLSAYARKYAINVIGGFAMRMPGEDKARNMAVFFNRKGRPDAAYAKIHPFSYIHEDKHYVAGITTVTFSIDSMPSGMFICYDLRFPELFRSIAKGVQAIFVIANWPASREAHWEALLKARAIENQCFIIGVNRTGDDGNGIKYPGASHVFDPLGNDICCGNGADEYITCEFDPERAAEVRREFPFLNDMKPFTLRLYDREGKDAETA